MLLAGTLARLQQCIPDLAVGLSSALNTKEQTVNVVFLRNWVGQSLLAHALTPNCNPSCPTQSAASWLFPSSFDPPQPGSTPLSFLRRNKTAPPPMALAPGTSRTAAAAAARHITEFELACERLPEAEDVQSEGATGDGSTHGSKEGGGVGLEEQAPLPPVAAVAAGRAGAAGTVARNQTWPVYQSPAGGASMGGAGGGGFLPASYAALGFGAAGVQAAHSTHSVHAVSDPLLREAGSEVAVGLGGVAQQAREQGMLSRSSHSGSSQHGLVGPRLPAQSDGEEGISRTIDFFGH